MINRRSFVKSISTISFGSVLIPNQFTEMKGENYFKASLSPGSIGLKTDANKIISQAYKYNFSAISPLLSELISFSLKQIDDYRSKMKKHNLVFDAAGLPIQFRLDEANFLKGYEELKNNLPKISKFKIPGFITWIMPTNNEFPYLKNFNIHKSRLKKVARLLNKYDMKLGLEYVGPKTLMSRDKFPFIHTIAELRSLIHEIKEDNVGYLLDSFHMYCSEDKPSDYEFLKKEDIVSVQINDAVMGRSPSEQIDFERNLPGITGVINLKQFLSILKSKFYNGCISVEPFNKEIYNMEENKKLIAVSNSLQNTFNLV